MYSPDRNNLDRGLELPTFKRGPDTLSARLSFKSDDSTPYRLLIVLGSDLIALIVIELGYLLPRVESDMKRLPLMHHFHRSAGLPSSIPRTLPALP